MAGAVPVSPEELQCRAESLSVDLKVPGRTAGIDKGAVGAM